MWWGLAAVVVAGLMFVPDRVEQCRRRRQRVRGLHPERHLCRPEPTTSRPTSRARTTSTTSSPTSPWALTARPSRSATTAPPASPASVSAAIYTDQEFSLVIADPDSDEAVACGDILQPDADEFEEAGRGRGAAAPGRVERGRRDRGHRAVHPRSASWTSRRPRCGSSSPPNPISVPGDAAAGYRGLRPGRAVRVARRTRSGSSSRARTTTTSCRSRPSPPTAGEPVTVASYGVRRRTWLRTGRGLHRPGLLAGHRGCRAGEPAGCGDILEADAEEFTEAGLALVQICSPTR